MNDLVNVINSYFASQGVVAPPKRKRDYIVENDDLSEPEAVETNKQRAITLAREMAKRTGENSRVIPCYECEPDDNADYIIVEPNGTATAHNGW